MYRAAWLFGRPLPEADADLLRAEGAEVDFQSVIRHPTLEHIGQDLPNDLRAKLRRPHQVDIPGWPRIGSQPMSDQQRALQYEAIAMAGRGQAVDEPLEAVEIEQLSEGASFRFGLGLHARLNRVGEPLCPPALQTSASRNGLTILSTRQIFAK
jgi:hypothetical protein